MMTGTDTRMRMCDPLRMTGSTAIDTSNGVAKPPLTNPEPPNHEGMNSSRPARAWARPMVATVRTRRDERAKRRMTRNSRIPPMSAPETTPAAMAIQ
jgi:hypothetical protein